MFGVLGGLTDGRGSDSYIYICIFVFFQIHIIHENPVYVKHIIYIYIECKSCICT